MALSRYLVTAAEMISLWFGGGGGTTATYRHLRLGVRSSLKVKSQNQLLFLLLFQFPGNLYRPFRDRRVKTAR